MTKPSDFPRDERFRDPATPPFRDADGNYDHEAAERVTGLEPAAA